MIIEAGLGVIVGFFVGYFFASYKDKTTERLRKRGYSIQNDPSYYTCPKYWFVYTYFDKQLNSRMLKGPELRTYEDAVANADAHYHARILNGVEQ